jgi:hypothetical protein
VDAVTFAVSPKILARDNQHETLVIEIVAVQVFHREPPGAAASSRNGDKAGASAR